MQYDIIEYKSFKLWYCKYHILFLTFDNENQGMKLIIWKHLVSRKVSAIFMADTFLADTRHHFNEIWFTSNVQLYELKHVQNKRIKRKQKI